MIISPPVYSKLLKTAVIAVLLVPMLVLIVNIFGYDVDRGNLVYVLLGAVLISLLWWNSHCVLIDEKMIAVNYTYFGFPVRILMNGSEISPFTHKEGVTALGIPVDVIQFKFNGREIVLSFGWYSKQQIDDIVRFANALRSRWPA